MIYNSKFWWLVDIWNAWNERFSLENVQVDSKSNNAAYNYSMKHTFSEKKIRWEENQSINNLLLLSFNVINPLSFCRLAVCACLTYFFCKWLLRLNFSLWGAALGCQINENSRFLYLSYPYRVEDCDFFSFHIKEICSHGCSKKMLQFDFFWNYEPGELLFSEQWKAFATSRLW